MPFGNQSGPTVVYRYYARRPADPDAVARLDAEIRGMNRYRNALVELEVERRRRYNEIMASVQGEELTRLEARRAEIEAALEVTQVNIRARNREARKRTSTAGERTVRALTAERREIRARAKELRAAGKEQVQPELGALEEWSHSEARRLRGECGLFWPNYLQIEQSMSGSRSGPPPKFHRTTPWGKVAVQLQGGLTMADAYGGDDTRFRLVKPPGWAYDDPKPKAAIKRLWRTTATMRIGSTEKGVPIWCEIPVLLHRLPPEDALIKWVYLTRRQRRGTQEAWELQLVMERKAGWAAKDCARGGAVGIDIGWRIFDDRLRVAVWSGADGTEGELSLPVALIERWQKADSLRSVRDTGFNTALDALAEWLGERDASDVGRVVSNDPQSEEEFRRRTATLRQWRSPGRLARLVRYWSDHRLDGDEAIYHKLTSWRRNELRLLRQEMSHRERPAEERNELFKRFAAHIRRRYRTVCVEEWNIRETLARPTAQAAEDNPGARLYHRMAAPGYLRQLVTAKAAAVERIPAAMTTQTCSECRKVDRFDAAAYVDRTCQHCGVRIDQDIRAARNLLRLGREQFGGGGNGGGARVAVSSASCGAATTDAAAATSTPEADHSRLGGDVTGGNRFAEAAGPEP